MTYAIIGLLTVATLIYGLYVIFPEALRPSGQGAKRWAYLFGITLLLEILAFAAAPLFGWWMPLGRSTYAWDVDRLFYVILAVTGATFIGVAIVYTYVLFKYPAHQGRRALYTHGNHKLEMIWTAIPGVLLFLLAIGQIPAWLKVKMHAVDEPSVAQSLQVEVTGRQWEWRVRYPGPEHLEVWKRDPKSALTDLRRKLTPQPDDVRLVNELHAVKGERLLIHLKTLDVIHSLFLPQMRLKQDALPGKTILAWFEPTEANCQRVGDVWRDGVRKDAKGNWVWDPSYVWEIACTEFCGSRHSLMRGKLFVHETREDFEAWLKVAAAKQRVTVPPTETKAAGANGVE
ncbi:MAG: cytochrome c oxidase subunit II [Gemmataceae bacterium]|nr:cytochrome c oxidase subunit II [Gemmataceae bacterium]